MSADELLVYSQKGSRTAGSARAQGNELAVLYGYLAPVNAFGALTAD